MKTFRLRRRDFWLSTFALWLAFFVLREAAGLAALPAASTMLAVAMLLAITTLAVARLHDRALGGWALVALGVPVVGAVWLFIELACRAGTRGDNRFGPDPRTHNR